jgi:hypothetical protein
MLETKFKELKLHAKIDTIASYSLMTVLLIASYSLMTVLLIAQPPI